MKKTNYGTPKVLPTANICISKSRIKVYENENSLPTYYLNKGQEFQLEIYNPTSDVILAKISLNNKPISQGGLVLNPAQRVFLDRYLDIPKKFMFDTYEVENTDEAKQAIAQNGDIKIEFFKEKTMNVFNGLPLGLPNYPTFPSYPTFQGMPLIPTHTTFPTYNTLGLNNDSTSVSVNYSDSNITYNTSSVTLDGLSNISNVSKRKSNPIKFLRGVSKSIETGRIEKGSTSNQKLEKIDKDFENFSFHKVEYKLLPISQKINDVSDINVKVYCTNCGHKLGKTDNFCSTCGTKK